MSGQRHPDSHVSKARTVDEAVAEALLYLGARRNEVDVEVLDEGSPGLLGLIGRRPAVVKVTRRRRGGRGERKDRKPAPPIGAESREAGTEGGASRSTRRRRRPRRDRDVTPAAPAEDGTAARETAATRSGHASPRDGDGARSVTAAAAKDETAAGNAAPAEDRPRKRRRRRRRKPRSEESRPAAGSDAPVVETAAPERSASASGKGGASAVAPAAVRETADQGAGRGSSRSERAGEPRPRRKESKVQEHRAAELVTPHDAASPSPAEAAELQRSLAAELMRRGGFLSRCTVEPGDYNQVRIVTDGDSAAVLIGHHGHTIDAVEHLVDRMSARIMGTHVPVNVDINNYRRRREGQLVSLARRAMSQVRATGEEVHLPPQNARDRRVIHLEVAEYEGLTTYSDGEGLERHVVVTLEGKVPDWYQPPVKPVIDDGGPGGKENEAPSS